MDDQNMNQNGQQTLPPSQSQYQITQPQPTYEQQPASQPQPTYQQPVYEQPQQSYQQTYQQPVYEQPQMNYQQPYQQYNGPLLTTDRSIWKFILFSIITLGIYPIVVYTKIANEINLVASARDGKKTTHYCLMAFVLAPITCGIYGLYWWHTISNRIGEEARARGSYTTFNAGTFWLWQLVGTFVCGIGPFIFIHKLLETMNEINSSYNRFGR